MCKAIAEGRGFFAAGCFEIFLFDFAGDGADSVHDTGVEDHGDQERSCTTTCTF